MGGGGPCGPSGGVPEPLTASWLGGVLKMPGGGLRLPMALRRMPVPVSGRKVGEREEKLPVEVPYGAAMSSALCPLCGWGLDMSR